MTLNDTIPLMLSGDFRERLLGEYHQLRIRYDKLSMTLREYRKGKAKIKCKPDYATLEAQLNAMKAYMDCLESRLKAENITFDERRTLNECQSVQSKAQQA